MKLCHVAAIMRFVLRAALHLQHSSNCCYMKSLYFQLIAFVFLLFFSTTLHAQVTVTDNSTANSKRVPVSSFKPATIVFQNDSVVQAYVSFESNSNYLSGIIDHVTYLNSLPSDSLQWLKTKEVPKLYIYSNVKHIELKEGKAVFQIIGNWILVNRVVYEDAYSRVTCPWPYTPQILQMLRRAEKGYNSYVEFAVNGSFTGKTKLIGIHNPRFAGRRSEKAFVKEFKDYPELVEKIKDKAFVFDALDLMDLMQQYKTIKAAENK